MFNCECGADLIQEDCETILDVCQEAPVVKDYETLANKPQINGVTLDGNKTSEDLGITQEIADAVSAEATLRENADTALGGRIDDEITNRGNADTALGGRIDGEITNRTNADNALGTRIDNEILARQGGDNNLQTQIDAITSKSDVVDVVANYAALRAYDTSSLGNNDVIKVLDDETHEDALTYYRWSTTTQTWSYIGQEAPYYSKGQMDVMLQGKQDKLTAGANIQIQNGTISATDTTYTAGNGLNLNDGEFSADTDILATKEDLEGYYTKTETDAKLAPKLETEVVSALPATGTEGKLYLTPKAHTTQTATGNPVTASVTEQAGALESFQLDGDTAQQTYSGKNLLMNKESAQEKTGITITPNSDGSFTLNGTATTVTDFYFVGSWQNRTISYLDMPSGDYTISLLDSAKQQIASPKFRVELYDRMGEKSSRILWLQQGLASPQTTNVASYAQITAYYISIQNGTSFSNEKFYIQLETGSTATSFEPFVGGQASPNPDYPQPIQTVTGEQTVTVIGKNLFNKNAVTNGGYIDTNGEVVAWETFGYSEYIRVIGGQTYSYSGTANNVGYSAKAAWYDSNKNFISYFSFGTSGQVTAPATAKFLRTSVRIASPSGLDTYQLELGSTVTAYEAYKATNYPISLGSIELCKLGTYQDYIYKDGNDWKVHKTTSKATFSDLDWQDYQIGSTGHYRVYSSGITQTVLPPSANNVNFIGYCSIYENKTSSRTYAREEGCSVQGDGYANTGTIFIYDADYDYSGSATSWKEARGAGQIYFVLKTATDTVITDTALIAQLEAIRTASLATGASTITNTATAPNIIGDMEIGYYGCNPTNRYDKWIWLDFDNSYEQLNNPEPTATLSTRSLSTTTEQTTPTRSVETVTLKKGASEPVVEKTEEAVKEEDAEPVVEDSEIKEEPEEENSEQVESEKEKETKER